MDVQKLVEKVGRQLFIQVLSPRAKNPW